MIVRRVYKPIVCEQRTASSTTPFQIDGGVFMILRTRASLALLGLVAVLSTAYSTQGQTDAFTLTGSMISARYSHTMTLLSNGNVLVAGGCSAGSDCLATAEVYSPTTASFSTTGSMSAKRWGHTATLLQNGLVLIAGALQSRSHAPTGWQGARHRRVPSKQFLLVERRSLQPHERLLFADIEQYEHETLGPNVHSAQ